MTKASWVLLGVGVSLAAVVACAGVPIERDDAVATAHLAMIAGAESGVSVEAAAKWVGCGPCRTETISAPSRDRTFVVSEAPHFEIRAHEVARATVREELRLEDASSSYFVVSLERADRASDSFRTIHRQVPLWLAFEHVGQTIGIQPIAPDASAPVRIGWRWDRSEAEALGARFGRVEFEASTRAALEARREAALDVVAGAFWLNRCDPDSDAARAQQAGYEIMVARLPSLPDRIDCDASP